jgi:5-methylcytosine-specific restriction endonuclease McrA
MSYGKYTRYMLTAAVAASTSMAGVMRHLGLRLNGGSHAHLRRRITALGIDTSHFLGIAHARGTRSPRRKRPDEILIERPPEAKRQAPTVLRRALEDLGRPYACAECGIGGTWNGRTLSLQVDHIDGQFWNCLAENLRFLCPNCHSQTPNYAGRNRPRRRNPLVRVDEQGNPVKQPEPAGPLDEKDRVAVLQRAGRSPTSPGRWLPHQSGLHAHPPVGTPGHPDTRTTATPDFHGRPRRDHRVRAGESGSGTTQDGRRITDQARNARGGLRIHDREHPPGRRIEHRAGEIGGERGATDTTDRLHSSHRFALMGKRGGSGGTGRRAGFRYPCP